MKVKWYGQAAFRLVSETGFTIITDPYTPELLGYAPIRERADMVIVSSLDDQAHCRHDLIPGEHIVVNALEVVEKGGEDRNLPVPVRSILAMEAEDHPLHEPGQNGMYRFELDGIKIAHMGDVGNPLNDEQIAFFEETDLLLALAGAELTIDLDDLMVMIHQVRPRLIIPMHFRTLTYKPRNSLWIESFLSYFEKDNIDFAFDYETEISREDIPGETRVLVLDYAR
ncbi:MAG: MBL fold metallo-hydrolase [Alkalispirochaetaceae bacterium]